MGAGLFWGIILIVIGLSIIFRVVFDVNIFRVAIGILLIFFGIKVLLGKNFLHSTHRNDVLFNKQVVTALSGDYTEYNVIFGKAVYDLRNLDLKENKRVTIDLNTVFGDTELYLNPDIPVNIKAESVLGNILLPDGNSTSFGTVHFTSGEISDSSGQLRIKAHAVFGNIEIRR